MLICTTSFTISYYGSAEFEQWTLHSIITFSFLFFLPDLFNMAVEFQYSIYAIIVKSRYEALNNYLESILEDGSVQSNGK